MKTLSLGVVFLAIFLILVAIIGLTNIRIVWITFIRDLCAGIAGVLLLFRK